MFADHIQEAKILQLGHWVVSQKIGCWVRSARMYEQHWL